MKEPPARLGSDWSGTSEAASHGEGPDGLCERDLCVAHLLVSENARFDAVDGYATFQSSDALIVEADGEWQKAEQ